MNAPEKKLFTVEYLRVCNESMQGKNKVFKLLAEHSRVFPEVFDDHGYERGIPNRCYNNACNLAFLNPELTYVEGYAMGPIPVEHAWCVDQQGRVIDTTWETDMDRTEYFGIPFKTEFVRAVVQASGYPSMLFNPKNKLVYQCDPAHFVQEL